MLTRQPTSLAINHERCEMLGLAQENARARWSALNALFGDFCRLIWHRQELYFFDSISGNFQPP